jgi:HEAT repeat protein
MCDHWHADVRAAAVRVLPEIVVYADKRAISELLLRLQDGGHPYRGSFKKKCISHPVRIAAIEGLSKLSPLGDTTTIAALVFIIGEAEEEDADVVIAAIITLAVLAQPGYGASIGVLMRVLKPASFGMFLLEHGNDVQESQLIRAAVTTLNKLGHVGNPDASVALYGVMRYLVMQKGTKELQDVVWMTLKKMLLPSDATTVALIKEFLQSPSSRQRCLAVETMMVVAKKGDEDAVIHIVKRGGDPNRRVRRAVIQCLCKICNEGDPRVRRLLLARMNDWDARTRDIASQAIKVFDEYVQV